MSLARGAALLCQKPAFQKFLAVQLQVPVPSAEQAAQWVRQACEVQSRAEFDRCPRAAQRWQALVKLFNQQARGR